MKKNINKKLNRKLNPAKTSLLLRVRWLYHHAVRLVPDRHHRYAVASVVMVLFGAASLATASALLPNDRQTSLQAGQTDRTDTTMIHGTDTPEPVKVPENPAPAPVPVPAPAAPSAPACPAPGGNAQPKGMWVWQSSAASDAGQRAAVLSFATSRNVQTIYLESEKLINTDQGSLATFVREAKQKCINVDLLFGAADWAFTANHAYPVSLAQKAVAFARSAAVPPAGIQFDVEPYNTAAYQADPNSGANQYLDLLEKISAATRGGSLYFAMAMPLGYEFQVVTRGGSAIKLSHATIDRVDKIILMDYRDTASRIIDDASDEVSHAAAKGKKIVIGVETDCNTGEVQTITFCEEGVGVMESNLAKVSAAYGGYGAFRGVAVHDYAAYKILKP